MIQQGQQVDEANDATSDKTNEAIGVGVFVEAVDSDNEADWVLDNQLTELEKLDAVNKTIDELDELVKTKGHGEAEGHDEVKGHVQAKGHDQAKGHQAKDRQL